MNNHKLQDLINNFHYQKLVPFINEKNNNITRKSESLLEFNDDDFTNGIKLGEIPFSQKESMIICAFSATKPLSERSGKKTQFDKAIKILDIFNKDSGIFVFYDKKGNFRISLIFLIYKGKKREKSNFKRFTYFVSPELTNKTFLNQVGSCDFKSLETIQEAFSVKKVTDKFFDEFRTVFDRTKNEFEEANKNTVCLWLKSKYEKADYDEQVNKFTFTFLGRIIFLYFLLRKGWIEDQSDYIRKIFEDKNKHNLYLDVLSPLFFDVFAKQVHERPREIQNQYKNTPYLNGGLFEHSDLEAEMAKAGKFILFGDDFLRDLILEFFEVYNFTVDENSPNDQEVSIDPEMLGKVFENTLAEGERNKKGTFYTPREIVHFMVKDSIRQFLHNETNIDLSTLQKLVYGNDENLDFLPAHQIRQIDSLLENIKILDPAVGSGAFPVEFMQVLIELRKRLNVRVGRYINEVSLKKQLIKNNLYGVDIDPGAIEISKLRLWLALIVDYDKTLAEPLPNLDFQFRVGNSLQEKIDEIDIFNDGHVIQKDLFNENELFDQLKSKMIHIKDNFYLSNDEGERHSLKHEFDSFERQLIQAVLDNYEKQLIEQARNKGFQNGAKQLEKTTLKINSIKQKIKDGTYKLFKPDFHFSEVFDRKDENGNRVGGFDIVIGNPPYGVSIDNDIKDWHALGSRDSYGVFISTSLKRFLKQKGVLEFIVSDTWLTIRTHKPLREQVLSKWLHKIIRLHQDCFDATVNPCILGLTNKLSENQQIVVADMTNISTREEIEILRNLLYSLEDHIGDSTPNYGIYAYDQKLIKTYSNSPIFVGSPKLFALMQDEGIKVINKEIGGKTIPIRQIKINENNIELVRFGDIADVKVGLQTGENKSYLFQNPEARGSYRNINDYKDYLLTEEDLLVIATNDNRRKKVIQLGIHKKKSEKNFDSDRWFEGRYIVPYDKGGESDTDSGWLPNYYVPSNYFIDWSTWAIKRMKTLTIGDKDGTNRKEIAAVFRNTDTYFMEGITFSDTGFYAPTFRINSISIYDVMGMSIFTNFNVYHVLSIVCGKLCKYLVKNFINHTVHTQVEGVKPIPIIPFENKKLIDLVKTIISMQKKNLRYNYLENEQFLIDSLVYEIYGLDKDDIKEVETWYARRYPKLAHLCDT